MCTAVNSQGFARELWSEQQLICPFQQQASNERIH